MNAKLIGLFSGFPTRRFPADIARRLRETLTERRNLVFVSAWPDEYARNDEDAAGMHHMFVEYGMAFDSFTVIDRRTAPADARQLIRMADCVFLMGGHPTQQMQLIREKEIEGELCASRGVLLGVSAGAINMARRALDVWESPVPYEGVGLTNITIKAHVNPGEQALLRTLQQVSAAHLLPICAMEDESAIFVQEGQISCIGQIRYICGSEVFPFSPELLCH